MMSQMYRDDRVKDPERYKTYKAVETEKSRERRRRAGPDDIARDRELARLRAVEYRSLFFFLTFLR